MQTDIISFLEPVSATITPVQRLALKVMYGLDLDARDATLPAFRGDITPSYGGLCTEAEYVGRLADQGRVQNPAGARHAALSAGRRSGKGWLVARILAFEIAQLVTNPETEGRWDVVLATFTVAAAEDVLYHFDRLVQTPLLTLADRAAHRGHGYRRFQTDEDIRDSGPWHGSRRQARASVSVQVLPAKEQALCGHRVASVVLDEFAAFPASSARRFREAAEWAVGRDPHGRVLALSTPKAGSDFDSLLEHEHYRSVALPTWEMRGSRYDELSEFRAIRAANPTTFYEEWAAEPSRVLSKIRIPADVYRKIVSRVGADAVEAEIVRILRAAG